MGKHAINKHMLKIAEEAMRANGSRFVVGIALADDGYIDVFKNMHLSEAEFTSAIVAFIRQYPSTVEGLKEEILKQWGIKYE